jgi:hypothetical protein
MFTSWKQYPTFETIRYVYLFLSFTLEIERSVMFAADSAGQLIAVYRPQEVQITVELV